MPLLDEIEQIFQGLEADSAKILKKDAGDEPLRFERSLDMRFVGQGSEVNVLLPAGDFTRLEKAGRFGASSMRPMRNSTAGPIRTPRWNSSISKYGPACPSGSCNCLNWRAGESRPWRQAVRGRRQAYSPLAREFIPYTVYDRYQLFPGPGFQVRPLSRRRSRPSSWVRMPGWRWMISDSFG